MPPGQTIPMDLSYAVAKKVCSQQDLERLACAYLASTATVNFDADKAAKEFGGGKGDSFKRQIWVITKRIKDNMGEVDGDGDEHSVPPTTPKTNGGTKRKAAGPVGSAKGSAKKGKKAKNEAVTNVKPEPEIEPAEVNGSDDENILI